MAVYDLGCSVQARISLFNYINKLFYIQQLLIIKGLKSKPFKQRFNICLQIKKMPYVSYDVCCNTLAR